MHDDELPIKPEGLVSQIGRVILGALPGSARITVGNLFTGKKGNSELKQKARESPSEPVYPDEAVASLGSRSSIVGLVK